MLRGCLYEVASRLLRFTIAVICVFYRIASQFHYFDFAKSVLSVHQSRQRSQSLFSSIIIYNLIWKRHSSGKWQCQNEVSFSQPPLAPQTSANIRCCADCVVFNRAVYSKKYVLIYKVHFFNIKGEWDFSKWQEQKNAWSVTATPYTKTYPRNKITNTTEWLWCVRYKNAPRFTVNTNVWAKFVQLTGGGNLFQTVKIQQKYKAENWNWRKLSHLISVAIEIAFWTKSHLLGIVIQFIYFFNRSLQTPDGFSRVIIYPTMFNHFSHKV